MEISISAEGEDAKEERTWEVRIPLEDYDLRDLSVGDSVNVTISGEVREIALPMEYEEREYINAKGTVTLAVKSAQKVVEENSFTLMADED